MAAEAPTSVGRPSQAATNLSTELESITAVQKKLLARLEGARHALSPPGLAEARGELAEVVEELSHSGALLVTLKKELDSIYARLRTLRRSLRAAFPEHASAAAAEAEAAAPAPGPAAGPAPGAATPAAPTAPATAAAVSASGAAPGEERPGQPHEERQQQAPQQAEQQQAEQQQAQMGQQQAEQLLQGGAG